jgi:hypothetical protein
MARTFAETLPSSSKTHRPSQHRQIHPRNALSITITTPDDESLFAATTREQKGLDTFIMVSD